MPSSLTREKSPSNNEAPSSIEYSVCTCRWAKSPPEPVVMERGSHLPEGSQDRTRERLGTTWGRGSDYAPREADPAMTHRLPPRVAQKPPGPRRAKSWSRAIRSAVGGCVENNLDTSPIRNGLAIIM